MSNINPDIEALAHVLATIESRRPEWGFSLDAALEYREEKWSRHIWEAQRLFEEMTPWLFEHDAALIESLAERSEAEFLRGSWAVVRATSGWLRERAQQIREGKTT